MAKINDAIKHLATAMTGNEPAGKTIKQILRNFGEDLTQQNITGDTIADTLNDIADKIGGFAPTLSITTVADDVDLLGKHASDLARCLAISTTESGLSITGTLLYVPDYEGFAHGAKGNFLPLHFSTDVAEATITVEIIGGTSGAVTLDPDGLWVGKIASNEQSIQAIATYDGISTTINVDISNLYLTPEPAPATLTPFEVDQTITGLDFGNVNNGDTSADMDAFVSYPAQSEPEMILFASSDNLFAGRMVDPDSHIGILMVQEGEDNFSILYATDNGTINGNIPVTKGFQNLTDGKFDIGTAYTLDLVNDQITGWNGILIGAVIGEPPVPVGLTPFSVGQSFGAESLKVNVNKTAEEVASVIANMEDGTELVNALFNDSEIPLITVVDDTDGGKCIGVADAPIFVSNSYEYEDKDTGETITVSAGWQYDSEEMPIDRETGIVDLSGLFAPGMVSQISGVNSEVTGWNGEIVGYGNEPAPTQI